MPAVQRPSISAALCAGALGLRLLSVTGFRSACPRLGRVHKLPTGHMAWPRRFLRAADDDPVRGRSGHSAQSWQCINVRCGRLSIGPNGTAEQSASALITARRPAVGYLQPGFRRLRCNRRKVFCVLFPTSWMHYLNSVSAADLIRSPLSLLFLELSGYYLNVVQRHVYAADVLVRCGVDRDDFR